MQFHCLDSEMRPGKKRERLFFASRISLTLVRQGDREAAKCLLKERELA
jgi:hypothetical protein